MRIGELLGYKSEKELENHIKKLQKEGRNIKLVSYKKRPKILQCVCGSKRREHWTRSGHEEGGETLLKCVKCGLEREGGTSENEAIENYNKKVLSKQKEEMNE